MRIGVYFIPGDDPVREPATNWLGYDIACDSSVIRPAALTSLVPDIDDITSVPRRYGLHATIKAPFQLAEGYRLEELREATAHLCAMLQPFSLPSLELTEIGSFFCLVPGGDTDRLHHLAALMVNELDRFRAPLTEEARRKRINQGLSARQLRHLEQWGYPYVMEDYRFHLTLTGSITDIDARRKLRPVLESHLAASLGDPLNIDALCLVAERSPKSRFELLQKFPLGEE